MLEAGRESKGRKQEQAAGRRRRSEEKGRDLIWRSRPG
jgi:hypothetical protein